MPLVYLNLNFITTNLGAQSGINPLLEIYSRQPFDDIPNNRIFITFNGI